MFNMKKWVIAFALFLVAGVIFAGWQGLEKIDRLNERVGILTAENQQLSLDVDKKSALISEQSLSFHRANQIAGDAYRRGIIQRAAAEERKIEYKTLLKNEPTCDLPVPKYLADRVLDNAYRIRANAMRSHSENTNPASTPTATGRVLTYCDLALMVDPLLAALETTNIQLGAIELFDEERNGEKTH
ncbi:DUF2570 domain-containing protein [Providencia sp. PROV130]|uniref:DUF2570 domain-containing protein n=1 Tax=Providencia sp. PROV130 TaxID=2949840 RepID=UPI00234B163F|nr:DUF2570 domain-containing protein [Providencia sp. PROV130]